MPQKLDGFKPVDPEMAVRTGRGKNIRLLKEFYDSGHDCICRDMGSKNKARNKVRNLNEANHRTQLPIKIMQRETRVFIMRDEAHRTGAAADLPAR